MTFARGVSPISNFSGRGGERVLRESLRIVFGDNLRLLSIRLHAFHNADAEKL
jgi:hypothetical protein